MATTSFSINHPLSVTSWSRRLSYEISRATPIAPLIGTQDNNIIQLKDELMKSSGDQVVFALRRQLTGSGVSEGISLEGNEEALTTNHDRVYLNELSHAVRVKNDGTIDVQRIPYNLREEANNGLIDWYAERLSLMAFLHFCGYTGNSLSFEGQSLFVAAPVYRGFNTPQAPSNGRWIIANERSSEQALLKGDVFKLSFIDKAVELAKLANPKIRPVRIQGDPVYVMYLHPAQVTALRSDTAPNQWLDIQKAAYSGSRAKNPIFDGSLGMYNGVILRESAHVTSGLKDMSNEDPTVKRAVLLGAQAGIIAFGKNRNIDKYKIVEETFDYQRELGVAAKTILGFKKTVFNNRDFAAIVVSTKI